MAAFSLKKYASKIYAYELFNELFKKHTVSAFFEISESVPRKAALDIIQDTFKGIDIGKRIDIEKELSYVSTFTTPHAASLYKKILTKELGVSFEPEIECPSDADLVLYCFLRYPEFLTRMLFLHDFYMSKNYMVYEAPNKDINFSEKESDLVKDFERLSNKDDNATECKVTFEEVDGIFYLSTLFEGRYEVAPKIDKETGELDRTHSMRKVERIFLAYIKEEERVIIRGTVGRTALTHFLDSYLRIVLESAYEGKKEKFELGIFKNLGFDFVPYNKGTPLLRWKIKAIALSYANGKKKLRLALPSDVHSVALMPLSEALEELGMISKYETFSIDSLSLTFSFADKEHEGKSIQVSTSLSPKKHGLCPLFETHNYVRKLLSLTDIDKGFVVEE